MKRSSLRPDLARMWHALPEEKRLEILTELDETASRDHEDQLPTGSLLHALTLRAAGAARYSHAVDPEMITVTDPEIWADQYRMRRRATTEPASRQTTVDWFAAAIRTAVTAGRTEENDVWREIEHGWQTERAQWETERQALRSQVIEAERAGIETGRTDALPSISFVDVLAAEFPLLMQTDAQFKADMHTLAGWLTLWVRAMGSGSIDEVGVRLYPAEPDATLDGDSRR